MTDGANISIRLPRDVVKALKKEAKGKGMIFSRYVAQIIEARHGGK